MDERRERRAPPSAEQVAEQVAQAVEVATAVEAVREPKPNVVVVIAVKGIILVTVLALIGAVVLIFRGQQPPDGVIAIASSGVGSLATLLTVRGMGDRPA